MDLPKVGLGMGVGYGLEVSNLEQGEVTGCCKCGNEYKVPIKCDEFLSIWKPVSFSRSTLLLGGVVVIVIVIVIIIIIIIIIIITFMQGIYNYVPETNRVSRDIVLQLFCIYNICYV